MDIGSLKFFSSQKRGFPVPNFIKSTDPFMTLASEKKEELWLIHRLSCTTTVLRRKSSTVTSRNRVCILPDASSLKQFDKLRSPDIFVHCHIIVDPCILVWIRIRGSVPLTYGSGFGSSSGSCFFRQWLTRSQQKISFFLKVSLLIRYFLRVHLHQFS
jgi:hypothetical protein